MGTGSIQLQDPVSDIPPQHDPAYFYDSTQQFDTNWAEPDNQGNNNNKGRGLFSFFNNNRNTKQPLVNTVNRQQQSPLASNEYGATTTTSPTTDNPVFLPATHYATLPTSNNMTEKFPGEDDPLVNPDDVEEEEEEEEEGLMEPHKNPCLHCLHFVEFLVIIILLGVLAAQIVPLFFLSPAQIGRVQTALR